MISHFQVPVHNLGRSGRNSRRNLETGTEIETKGSGFPFLLQPPFSPSKNINENSWMDLSSSISSQEYASQMCPLAHPLSVPPLRFLLQCVSRWQSFSGQWRMSEIQGAEMRCNGEETQTKERKLISTCSERKWRQFAFLLFILPFLVLWLVLIKHIRSSGIYISVSLKPSKLDNFN